MNEYLINVYDLACLLNANLKIGNALNITT